MDIIILIILASWMGRLAKRNGMNVFQWRMRIVGYTVGTNLLFAFTSYSITQQFLIAVLSGLLGGLLAAIIVFQWFYREAEKRKNLRQNNS